jgi:glutaminase
VHETAPDDRRSDDAAPNTAAANTGAGAEETAPSELLTYELLTGGDATPATNMVITALGQVLARHEDRTEGAVADYIPELAKVDPDRYGVALASVHGRVYTAGHCSTPFTIQSVSKPFVYALALEDLGLDRVSEHIDFEPSGEPFNAISLDESSGRPSNPLINAGAIVSTSLVAADGADERFARIRGRLSAFAGRELELDEAVYASESATGDRNRALAHLAASSGVLAAPVAEAVDTYFKQCSLVVTAKDLAVMGATLANSGVNPVTGETVIHESTAMTVLSVMATCGMYDDSGEWMVRVGLPAKSGVGGGIVAVQPAEFGIGTFSPRLDRRGNSVRGIAALQDLSDTFGLHLLNHHRVPRSAIASRRGGEGELELTLRGELDFIAMEEIAHELVGFAVRNQGRGGVVTLDVTHVTLVRSAVEQFLSQAVERLRTVDVELRIVDRTEDD